MRMAGIVALAAAFALGTWVLGWISTAVIALVFGVAAARRSAPWEALLAAVVAWLVLLGVQALGSARGEVARVVGAVVGVPAWAIPVATILFVALLACSAAVVGREIAAVWSASRARRTAP